MMDNPPNPTGDLPEDCEFVDAAQHQPRELQLPSGVRLLETASIMQVDVRQPAKIRMNIPHFQLATPTTPPKIMTPSLRGQHVDYHPRTISLNPGFNMPTMPRNFTPNVQGVVQTQSRFSTPLPTLPGNVQVQMQLDPGVLASFRGSGSDSPSTSGPPPQSPMINRGMTLPQQRSYAVANANNQFSRPPPSNPRIQFRPETMTVRSPMAQLIPIPITRPSVSLTVCKSQANSPAPIPRFIPERILVQESSTIGSNFETPTTIAHTMPMPITLPSPSQTACTTLASHPPQSPIYKVQQNPMEFGTNQLSLDLVASSPSTLTNSAKSPKINEGVSITLTTVSANSSTSPTLTPIILNNNANQLSDTTMDSKPPLTITTASSTPLLQTPSNTVNITPTQPQAMILNSQPASNIVISTASKTIPVPDTEPEPSSDKVGKLRGPKCYRQPEHRTNTEISLGPYQRPTKVPAKSKCIDVRREDIAMLVMPSEDWSCSVYPTPTSNPRQNKSIYVISETFLNSDLVEIVRKSISIQSNWGMKFSVMATDVNRFNLGLDASDITDIQAVLDNFDAFPICSGVQDAAISKPLEFSNEKVNLYSDKRYRSKECALLLVNFSDTKCSSCLKLMKTNRN